MSVMGQERTFAVPIYMSAFGGKADIGILVSDVSYVPQANVAYDE